MSNSIGLTCPKLQKLEAYLKENDYCGILKVNSF